MHLTMFLDPLFHCIIVGIILFAMSAWAQTSPYVCPTGQMVNQEISNIGSSCSTLAYSQLTGQPIIPNAQVNSDWNASSGLAQILNKPSISVIQDYENTTQRLNPIVINKTATVSNGAGTVAFNLTTDGTSTGIALCPNGVMLNSPNLSVNDATAPYQFSWVWSNANKTMTVLAEKATGIAVLTYTVLGLPAAVPNGTSINATVICY